MAHRRSTVAAMPFRSLLVHDVPSGRQAPTKSALAMSMPTKIAVDTRGLHVTRSVLRPGNVIVLDNLAVHKQPVVRTAIETVGASSGSATLHLPPYSPDFNPIELAFAKLKALLRAARPWTFNHVYALLAAAVELFTPSACRNFVRHCAYQSAIGL